MMNSDGKRAKSLAALVVLLCIFIGQSCGESTGSSSSNTGLGGSTATFALHEGRLYALKLSTPAARSYSLLGFDLTNPAAPQLQHEETIGDFVPETLIQAKNHLFVGSDRGVAIFKTDSETGKPEEIGFAWHFQARDPVVVSGDYAYATIREVRGAAAANSILVIDIQNIQSPATIKEISMQGPKGLGLANGHLYVCDEEGLAVFSLADPASPERLSIVTEAQCFDNIADTASLITTGESGVSQWSYNSEQPLPEFISTIETQQ